MTFLQPNLVPSKGELGFIVGVYREDAMNLWDLELVQLLKKLSSPFSLSPYCLSKCWDSVSEVKEGSFGAIEGVKPLDLEATFWITLWLRS